MRTWQRSVWIGAAVVVLAIGGVVALADTGVRTPIAPKGTQTALPMTADFHTSSLALSAPAAELINASTGQVLYAHNVTARHYPASIVKLMTSVLALELVKKGQMSLNTIVPVSQGAYQVARTPGLSVAYLNPLEKITLGKMLEYMYVVSADDAAVAIGDDIAGSEKQFAKMMNAKARALHMYNTHYTNASGLQNPKQYTTVQDIGILTRYLISHFPIVLKYSSEPGMYIHPGQYGTTYDQLLGQYKGLDGLKTGSTDQAGYCFVGTAKRGNTRLISIVLDAKSFPNVFQDTSILLDYGFGQFLSQPFQKANQPLAQEIRVPNGSSLQLAVAPKQAVTVQVQKGVKSQIRVILSKNSMHAPIAAGQQVGFENVIVQNHIVQQVPVYALRDDPVVGLADKLWRSFMTGAHQEARRIVSFIGKKLHKYIG